MKLAYTPIHPKFYLFSGVLLLSLLVTLSIKTNLYDVSLYIMFALVYSVLFFKINFFDYIEIKDHTLYIPTQWYKRKIHLSNFDSFYPITEKYIVLAKDEKKVQIELYGINENFILEFENSLESYGLKRI